jgi:tRNA dimethylallyltransferase
LKFPLFIVGGTGFYIQALEKGLYDVEPVPAVIKQNLEVELLQPGGVEKLYEELKSKDPETIIHRNDHYRIVRALEILRFTGQKPSVLKEDQNKRKNEIPFNFIKVGFNFEKEIFFEKVQNRTRQMITTGLIEETEFFLNRNFENWAPLSSVGYKETIEYLKQNKTKDWLFEAVNQSTMQLIKKQKTWFKRDSSILWSDQAAGVKQFLLED